MLDVVKVFCFMKSKILPNINVVGFDISKYAILNSKRK